MGGGGVMICSSLAAVSNIGFLNGFVLKLGTLICKIFYFSVEIRLTLCVQQDVKQFQRARTVQLSRVIPF